MENESGQDLIKLFLRKAELALRKALLGIESGVSLTPEIVDAFRQLAKADSACRRLFRNHQIDGLRTLRINPDGGPMILEITGNWN